MTPQEVADLRRTVRRLVEAASGEALEDARMVLEGHAAQMDVQVVAWAEAPGAVFTAVAMDAPGGPLTVTTEIPPLPRAERERRLDDLAAMTQDMGGYPELDRPPPTLAELAAARPRVTVPGRYCGDGHGVRIGRLVEDRDGVAQVQVAGYGVLNVPSGEVER